MEIEINSNDHKISNNKLRYYFNDTVKFENNSISLMECIFYTYFENIKETYSMKVKKDNDFYNIDFIDSQLEISDINNNNPKIQIIANVNTHSILIFIEKGLELHIDKDFQRIFGYSYSILRNTIQRSDSTPNVNKLNYIKIFLNIVDNKTEENYLVKVFAK